MKTKPFATEVDLCAAFLAALNTELWTPYAETAGWDILLVRKIDGFQIGIQAKLSLNVDVVNQAIEESALWSSRAGPDCRAVLVPEGGTGKLSRICDYVGLVVIIMYAAGHHYRRASFNPRLPDSQTVPYQDSWHEWAPTKRHKLPEYVPDVKAGSSAPLQLTDWKIKAIKLAVLLDVRGKVTRDDFKHLAIDHRRWIANEWLRVDKDGYVAGGMPNFKRQHPRVYAEIAAKADTWMPKTLALPLG